MTFFNVHCLIIVSASPFESIPMRPLSTLQHLVPAFPGLASGEAHNGRRSQLVYHATIIPAPERPPAGPVHRTISRSPDCRSDYAALIRHRSRRVLPGPDLSDYAALIRPTDSARRPVDCRIIDYRPQTAASTGPGSCRHGDSGIGSESDGAFSPVACARIPEFSGSRCPPRTCGWVPPVPAACG